MSVAQVGTQFANGKSGIKQTAKIVFFCEVYSQKDKKVKKMA